jgi:hypothetical protein
LKKREKRNIKKRERKEHKHEAQQDINEIKAGNIREDLPKNK